MECGGMLTTHVLHLHALAFRLQDASAGTQSICAPVKVLKDAGHPTPLLIASRLLQQGSWLQS